MAAITSGKKLLEAKIDSVSTEVTLIRADMHSMNTRLKEVEIKTGSLVTDTSELQQQMTNLQKYTTKLEEQLDYYGGRSRRNNVPILGVPENADDPATDLFVEDLVTKFLKPVRLSKFFTVQRAHRVPGGRAKTGSPTKAHSGQDFKFQRPRYHTPGRPERRSHRLPEQQSDILP